MHLASGRSSWFLEDPAVSGLVFPGRAGDEVILKSSSSFCYTISYVYFLDYFNLFMEICGKLGASLVAQQ